MRRRRLRRISLAFTAVSGVIGAATSAQTAPGTNQNAAAQRPPAGRAPADAKATAPAPRPVTNAAATEAGALMQRSGGSLLRASLAMPPDPNQARLRDVSFLAVPEPEPRTIKKHDLVTIVVREESAFSSTSNTDLKREANIDARIDEFVKFKLKNFEIQGGAAGLNPPSVKGNANREFKATGELDRTDSLTARITGEILDVKPNGTLVVQARKQIRTDEETQQFILTGICRAEDVNADNTVLSTQMFDLQLQKNHTGAVRDATKRGLLGRFLDFVNPF
jgi:flagellar L-ring protein precursor FlgH